MKVKKSGHIIIIVLLFLNHLSIFANEQESLNNHISDLKSSTLAPRSLIKNIYTPREISRPQQAEFNSNNIFKNLKVAGVFFTLTSILSLSDIIPFFTIAKAYAGENAVDVSSLTNYIGIIGGTALLAIVASNIAIKAFISSRKRKKLLKEYEFHIKPVKAPNREGKSLMWQKIYDYAWKKDKKNPQKGNWDLKAIMRILDYNYNTKHQSYKNRGKSIQKKKIDQIFFDDVMRNFFNEFDYNGEAIQFFNRKIINALTISLNHKVFNKGEAVYFGVNKFPETIEMNVEEDFFPASLSDVIFQNEFSQFVDILSDAFLENYNKLFADEDALKLSDVDADSLLKDIKIDLSVLKEIYGLDEDWAAFVEENLPDTTHLEQKEKYVSLYDLREFIFYIDVVTEKGFREPQEFKLQKYTFFKIAA